MAVADSVVVRVELIAPTGVACLMPAQMRLQQESFEEPVGVGQVPFWGTRVGHPLQVQIFGIQGLDQRLTALAHLLQLGQQHDVATGRCRPDPRGLCDFWRCWAAVS